MISTGQLARFLFGEAPVASTSGVARGNFGAGQRGFVSASGRQQAPVPGFTNNRAVAAKLAIQAPAYGEFDTRFQANRRHQLPPELQITQSFPEGNGTLPEVLYRLLDPAAQVELPPPGAVRLTPSDNRELDKLVAALGRNKATWRRALMLHEWLLKIGHRPDDRLCTTLIRVCAQHGQAATALAIYDWMRGKPEEGGAGLTATVYTYTAAMRAALSGNLMDRALQVWDDAVANHSCELDCRLCTTLIEVCARKGDTERALRMYAQMRDAPKDSKLAPSVHAYTAAMRAAAEGGRWEDALHIWEDMEKAGCKPTGHAYAAVISACAAGGRWQKAVSLFDEMLSWGVKPDVVSCTALITALGTDGQWERAEKVVEWMLRSDIKPNVRTYTALITALGNARQWDKALEIVARMKRHGYGAGIEPNAYTYSALLKTMGEQGKWALAEQVFSELEREQLSLMQREAELEAGSPLGGLAQHAPLPPVNVTSNALSGLVSPASVAAFPGMGRSAATSAAGEVTSSSGAIAAAAAAVAALAAAQRSSASGSQSDSPLSSCSASVNLGPASAGILQPADDTESVQETHDAAGVVTQSLGQVLGAELDAASVAGDAGSSCAAESAAASPFSYFGGLAPVAEPLGVQPVGGAWTTENAALQGLQLQLSLTSWAAAGLMPELPAASAAAAVAKAQPNVVPALRLKPLPKGKGPVNEVVCGALMLAYERGGKWEDAVTVLGRARALGIQPNTIMYNTAMSALGKASKSDAAEALFKEMHNPDAVSYETLIAAYGMAGRAEEAEKCFSAMLAAGLHPRDYAYCGLIAAHSFHGDWRRALQVRDRMRAARAALTVHAYNALLAACDRAQQYERALQIHREMQADGVQPNAMTNQLMEGVCKGGVRAVETQQAAAAALSAAVAAAGTLIMRAGIF
ncbi:hypothetical protein N2152v2_007721 [Parachlorella kessleri]